MSPEEQQAVLQSVFDKTEKQDEEHGVAHHGPPILREREAQICECMSYWIATVRQQGGYYKDFLPGAADIRKSRLFWRIRSGKKPLDHRPPTAYSCPWYELIDEPDRPHWAYELHEDGNRAIVAQCSYKVLERDKETGKPSLLEFGPWKFTLTRGPSPYNETSSGWWIQVAA